MESLFSLCCCKDCLQWFPLKSTPKKNILLPLNRFRTPYQNPLQQCNPYHTTPSIPHHPIFYISSPTTSSRQLLPGLSLYFSSSTGKSRRERRETERETRDGERDNGGPWVCGGRPDDLQMCRVGYRVPLERVPGHPTLYI